MKFGQQCAHPRVVGASGSQLHNKNTFRIRSWGVLLVTYVAHNRKKAGPDFLWISWALGPQSRRYPHFGHIGNCEKWPKMTIFEGIMKETVKIVWKPPEIVSKHRRG